jgi:hypothetical protein
VYPEIDSMTRYALIAAAALAASPAAAQISSALEAQGLDRTDTRMAIDAAATLWADDNPEVGESATWRNAETGSEGRVDVTAFDGRCVTVQHAITPGNGAAPAESITRRCRAEDGRWLIAND